MGIISYLFGKNKTDFKGLKEQGAVIVDVRTPAEFEGGHLIGSMNIPLDQVGAKVDMLLKKGKPIIICCQSGTRSGVALKILKSAGVEAYNGGSWSSLSHKI